MEQQDILARMINIVPYRRRLYELVKYDVFWHRYDGKLTEKYDKTLCGEIFRSSLEFVENENYVCDNMGKLENLPICPDCLKIWYEELEKDFDKNQNLGRFELALSREHAFFLRLFIRTKGYDALNDLINDWIHQYLVKENLIEKVREAYIAEEGCVISSRNLSTRTPPK